MTQFSSDDIFEIYNRPWIRETTATPTVAPIIRPIPTHLSSKMWAKARYSGATNKGILIRFSGEMRPLLRNSGLLEITGLKVRNGVRLDPFTENSIQLLHGCISDSVLKIDVALHGAAEFGLTDEEAGERIV